MHNPSSPQPRIFAAQHADFEVFADILARAFRYESFVSDFLHPRPAIEDYSEDEHLEDLRRYWRAHLRSQWFDKKYTFLKICCEKNSDDGEAKGDCIIGVAVWKKPTIGDSGWFEAVTRAFYTVYTAIMNTFHSIIYPDRSLIKSRTTAFTQALPFFQHHFTSPHYSLETLGVLPTAQGQGYGRPLVEWGLRRAARDGLPAMVVCSAGTERFYGKCGFDEDVGSVTSGEGNPLASVEGGRILVWRPAK